MTIQARTAALQALGQSLWLDYMKRGMLDGDLQRLIANESITGITSNPTIFEKAIAESHDYDPVLRILGQDPALSANALYERLSFSDIQRAADILRPVYERTSGRDGFVSIEVSPELANDTAGTVAEVRRFWKVLERPNLLIKIPGTPACVPAIRTALTEGINVNVTLLFSVAQYQAVAEAYLEALESRLAARLPIDRMASVASFFVSRVDTLCNKLIDEAVNAKKPAALKLAGLRGRIGIANSKLAYQKYLEIVRGPRWTALAAKGAAPQRVLWASTSTKDPKERDVRYLEALAGPETVDTIPPETLAAFVDHGEAHPLLTTDVEAARDEVARLGEGGLSLDEICKQLQVEGVAKFTASIVSLRKSIGEKVEGLRKESAGAPALAVGATDFELGALASTVESRLEVLGREKLAQRIWAREPAVWKSDAKHQAIIRTRLGWLDVAERMLGELPRLTAFVADVRKEGLTQAVLLGMGGSSLAPDVFRHTFGSAAGHLKLEVLDSTAPGAIRTLEELIELRKTLFVVSSKSGSTIETISLFRYFHGLVSKAVGETEAGSHFVCITDPGSGLEKLAREHAFREIFLNPSDLGGRYSALSLFGLVPAALMGVPLDKILERALAMARACGGAVNPKENPGLRLGIALAEAAKVGRDKLTLLESPELVAFSSWVEQLIAESTGKEGKGLVPIDQEPLGDKGVYGVDRIFASLVLGDAKPAEPPGPAVTLHMPEKLDLGAEFFRWEFATAVAGAVMGLDPFDEPNVQESKDHTSRILADLGKAAPPPKPTLSEDGLGCWTQASEAKALAKDLPSLLRTFFEQAPKNGYVALQAYLPPSDGLWEALEALRILLRDRLHLATTLGYGPRFLHSTGQLQKGGPPLGTFLQLTGNAGRDIAIPASPYGFAQLIAAQAEGDRNALWQRTPRLLRCDLGADPLPSLAKLRAAVEKALPKK